MIGGRRAAEKRSREREENRGKEEGGGERAMKGLKEMNVSVWRYAMYVFTHTVYFQYETVMVPYFQQFTLVG